MSTKTALLFVDDEVVKIAFGITLKCVKFSDLKLPHNAKFFEQIFSTHTVVVVDKISKLTLDAFDEFISKTAIVEEEVPVASVPAPATAQSKRQRSAPEILAAAAEDSGRMLFRSTDETTIIVDDLPTGEDLPNMPGIKKTLAIPPLRAIDLAGLPEESVKKSQILKRLIRDRKLVPCTPAEAKELQERFEEKTRKDNDDRLQHSAPILNESVENFVVNRGSTGPMHDAETVEVSAGAGEAEESGELTMEQLMRAVGADEAEAEPEQPAQKRQLAPRPAPENHGMKAKASGTRRV